MREDTFVVWVIPNAKKTQYEGLRETGERIIRLKAPPVEGKANEALIAFIAQLFNVSKRSVQIINGEKSRKKTIQISEPFSWEGV